MYRPNAPVGLQVFLHGVGDTKMMISQRTKETLVPERCVNTNKVRNKTLPRMVSLSDCSTDHSATRTSRCPCL